MKTIQPLNSNPPDPANPAADLVRQKLHGLYDTEPNAKEELQEAEAKTDHRSKHQRYMHELSRSGMSLAEIQTAWHNYYLGLPDTEKHQVWQEFYAEHERRKTAPPAAPAAKPAHHADSSPSKQPNPVPREPRSVSDIKKQLLKHVAVRGKQKGGHLKSLMFGLSCGLIVVVILLFSFFNERFIAPFISPSRTVSDSQIIIDPTSVTAGPEPKIIIPKINAELPVVYDEPSIDEDAVQHALENGVLHYATTPNPGELGNGTIFGHSSNNILNKGKYKFAFVLLKRLEVGDTFIIQKDSKRYVYRVFDKKVVKPEDVSILDDNQGKPATFSLVTCDPPGTSLNRLVVTGEQITPDPSSNVASSVTKQSKPAVLPSDSPTLWQRLTSWLES
ncbi:MAG TPA: sortase [Candidatus Limnocylindrales bacterium]|nr:sortase [Candidatus Limnocylindrales bacterium]